MRLGFNLAAGIVLLVISITGCKVGSPRERDSFRLQLGDLLFQDIDAGPLCDAIEKVTRGYRGANLTHVGVVAKNDNGELVVIEANPTGVEATLLEAFLKRSLDDRHRPKVLVGRLKPTYRHLTSLALKQAFALKGKPYDKVFAINNDTYYCSELVYEIFLRANDNKPLFELKPMTFNEPDTGHVFPAWKEYFENLQVPVPEGEPGINPGAISRSQTLEIVHVYGTPTGLRYRK